MSFQTFACRKICGVCYLVMDDREECGVTGSRQQNFALFFAFPALVLYLLITPSLTLMYIHSHRNVLLTDRKLVFRFGLLFSGYSSSRWYWEIFVIVRKLVIILIVTFGQTNQSQLHYALGALIVLLFLQEHGRPFEEGGEANDTPERMLTVAEHHIKIKELTQNRLLHRMEVISLLVLLSMVWSSVFLTLGTCEQNDMSCVILSGFVFLSNAIFFVICFYTTLKYKIKSWSKWCPCCLRNQRGGSSSSVVKNGGKDRGAVALTVLNGGGGGRGEKKVVHDNPLRKKKRIKELTTNDVPGKEITQVEVRKPAASNGNERGEERVIRNNQEATSVASESKQVEARTPASSQDENWITHVDPATDMPYYENKLTGETQWNMPMP